MTMSRRRKYLIRSKMNTRSSKHGKKSLKSVTFKSSSTHKPRRSVKKSSSMKKKKKRLSVGASIMSFSLLLGPFIYNSNILNPTSTAEQNYMKILKIINGNERRDDIYFQNLFAEVYHEYPDFRNSFRSFFPESETHDSLFHSLFNEVSILQFTFFLPAICLVLHKRKVITVDQYNYIHGKYRKLVNAILIAEAPEIKAIENEGRGGDIGGGSGSIIFVLMFMFLTFHSAIVLANEIGNQVIRYIGFQIKHDALKQSLKLYSRDSAPFLHLSSFYKLINNMVDGKSNKLIGDIEKIYNAVNNMNNWNDVQTLIEYIGMDTALTVLPKDVKIKKTQSRLDYNKDTEGYKITLKPNELQNTVEINIPKDSLLELIGKRDKERFLHLLQDLLENENNDKFVRNEFGKMILCAAEGGHCINEIKTTLNMYAAEMNSIFMNTGLEMLDNMERLSILLKKSMVLIADESMLYVQIYNRLLFTANFWTKQVGNTISFKVMASSAIALSLLPMANEGSEDESNPYIKVDMTSTYLNHLIRTTEYSLVEYNRKHVPNEEYKQFIDTSIQQLHSITTVEENHDINKEFKTQNTQYYGLLIRILDNPIYKKIIQQLEENQSDSKLDESNVKVIETKTSDSNEIEIAYI
jgi:hypothetical protein